eukprot:CAMPEP_0182419788 /NCGR_PEP_ID=MMETSP1167-20130531/4154_1 /TAXON_ID=2988 /ORGANISM="Mallomonas Sp, Strain CCMP3275" /LENGTH=1084 /DNA_ID=CAMNT_0024594885 /DNA_START=57 /DNA_END=3311 /DNA_ORIENTATION=-
MPLNEKVLQYNKDKSVIGTILTTTPLKLPSVLQQAPNLVFENHEALGAVADHEEIKKAFPNTYGRARISLKPSAESKAASAPLRFACVLSGGQAPGGHNVIAGIYDYIKKVNPDSVMLGFLDGPHGIYSGNYCVINDDMMDTYRNTGGFDMICSGRHKIEKPAEFEAAMENCKALDLDGLVVIGGDDSNTNAAVLAEYFEANKCKTKVCGAPKTIDGDLKVDPYIPISFGFDTACRTYSEQIGNLGQDTLSSQKSYHFVRLMGRAASNIALECALQTRPNVCLISEEVEAQKMTLSQITKYVADIIVKRSAAGKDYGIVLLPEGLIEFIPEFNDLISEINDILAKDIEPTEAAVTPHFSAHNKEVFAYLPEAIKLQLLMDRDPHGNVQVAKIETERLLAQTVRAELENLATAGVYGGTFSPQYHSYGYEGRSCFPSLFDLTYCYILGQTVAAMLSLGCNGLISSVTNLTAPVGDWVCGGVPITMLCHMEKRHGKLKSVIKKALVELEGEPFKCFASQRDSWAMVDCYRSPGPLQLFSDSPSLELCITLTLELTKTDIRMAPVSADFKKNAVMFANVTNAPLVGPDAAIMSETQSRRKAFTPPVIPKLAAGAQATGVGFITFNSSTAPKPASKIGVVVVGEVAPGMHDIISGIFDSMGSGSTVHGFVGGLLGLLNNKLVEITAEKLVSYRGQGGCELVNRSYSSMNPNSFQIIGNTCKSNSLTGLVLIGGSETIESGVSLNQYFTSADIGTKLVLVPADITGATINSFVDMSVGFDSFTKTAAELVGNNATDGASAKKYWYFMRIMGGTSSHTTLEVALKTKSNYVFLSEEILAKKMKLEDVVQDLADVIATRAAAGKNYGTVLIPEGIVWAIPEIAQVITEIEAYNTSSDMKLDTTAMAAQLSATARATYTSMPDYVQNALLVTVGMSSAVDISGIDTEKYLTHLITVELGNRKKAGTYSASFSCVPSYLGYQARGSLPTNFDVTLAYNLGQTSTVLLAAGLSGYIPTIGNLSGSVSTWTPGAVIAASAVGGTSLSLTSPVYNTYSSTIKEQCKTTDLYENPGPIQFIGPDKVIDSVPLLLSTV